MSTKTKTPAWALDNVRFTSDAGDDLTCREYLCELLWAVWEQEESFSSKRPFGNSGWKGDLLDALAEAKCIKRKRTACGLYPDWKAGNHFVARMIEELMRPTTPTPDEGESA